MVEVKRYLEKIGNRSTIWRLREPTARRKTATGSEPWAMTRSPRVWLAAPDNDYGNIVRLLMLIGCRRAEIGSLRWSEVDIEARTHSETANQERDGT